MVDAEEEPSLGEVHQQSHQVVAALLELDVLPLGQVVDSDVCFRPARHPAGDLFAHEEILAPAQNFRSIDGIVVRQREEVHPAAVEQCVHFHGIVKTFAAKSADEWGSAWPREVGVNMHIALHACNCGKSALQPRDIHAKVLKIQVLNPLNTPLPILTKF